MQLYKCVSLLGLFLWICNLHAAVEWNTKELQITADVNADDVILSFPFRVTGIATSFLESEIPCGCAFAKSDKPTYAPNESGVFQIRVLLEDRIGTQDLEVTVKTSNPTDPSHTLKATTIVPELITFSKKIIVWDARSSSNSITLTGKVDAKYPISTAVAKSSDASVAVSTTVVSPTELSVTFILESSANRKPVRIDVTTDLPVKRQAVISFWAVNKRP